MKKLIITEKPSVAQDYARVCGVSGRNNGYLENKDYVITWCVGHLVEMVYPEEYDSKYKRWLLEDLPFLPKDYKYGVIPAVKQQYEIVNGLLHREDIDTVYWAGDSGKEGQTIEENIRHFGGVRSGMKELRVWIDSQTDEEIRRGLSEAKPMSEYANLGASGVMRSIEDYAMGINFSRAMSVKYGKLLNDAAVTKNYTAIAVGRVMTCVLGMVVDREREIRNFTETAFYRVSGCFSEAGIWAEWKAAADSKYENSPLLYKDNGFLKEESANQLIEEVKGQTALLQSVERGVSKKRAPLLFNLAELQAECAKRFKISPDQTLQAAQELYEKKLTTYPRTDARVLTTAVAKEIGKNINRLKGYAPTARYVEELLKTRSFTGIAKTSYTDDSKVTDHYAIIPTGQLSELPKLSRLQAQVYDLIVRRFLSIFYPPAIYETLKLTIRIAAEKPYIERFFTSTKVLKTPGYLEVAGKAPVEIQAGEEQEGPDNKKLLELSKDWKNGDILTVQEFAVKEGKTSPPKRYTSGTIVLAMENAGQFIEDEELRAQIKGSGIGTSATRAEIIKKLIRIGYLNLNEKTQVLSPENLGEMIYEVVAMTVPALLNPKMTASWEKGLDSITKGTVFMEAYREKLEDFIRKETVSMIQTDLTEQIADKISPFAQKGARGPAGRRKLGVMCPMCGGELVTTPFGYGCSNYQKDGSGCKFMVGSIAGRELSEEEFRTLMTAHETEMLTGFVSRQKKKFNAALKMEQTEDGAWQIVFDFSKNQPEILEGVTCPLCGGNLVKTRFGYGCGNFKAEDANSCKFLIGRIAGKELTRAQVKELLSTGKTETIRGFKAKSGKKFDACLKLTKEENGNCTIQFDFEHVKAQVLKGAACPLCGGEIVITPFGYGCANYDRENPKSCRFMIGTIAGVKLTKIQAKELLQNKKTGVISGFVAKTGMLFDAPLKLTEDGKVSFDFPEKQAPVDSKVPCPKCHALLKKGQWQYECSCGFKVSHTVAGVALSEELMTELLGKGKTSEKIKGFTSKTGNVFDAHLKFSDDRLQFDFDSP